MAQRHSNGLGCHCLKDTYAESHTATQAGAAANHAAANKIAKYDELASTHIFYPVAIETRGTVPGITGLLSWSRKLADGPH